MKYKGVIMDNKKTGYKKLMITWEYAVEFSSTSPYSHIQIAMWIFANIVSPNKPA